MDGVSLSKVEDDSPLSPERGEEDSHQLNSSSMGAGEGGYSNPMEVCEFNCVERMGFASASRADVDSDTFSVAEDGDSVT